MLFKDFYDQVTSPRRGGPRFVEKGKKAWAKTLTEDPRSTARIAADALIDMLRLAAAADPGVVFGGNRPAVKVIVTQNTLTNTHGNGNGHGDGTGNGHGHGDGNGNGHGNGTGTGSLEGHPDPVPLETIDRHLCDTGFMPIMFDDDGQCVNVGRDQRLFTNRQQQGFGIPLVSWRYREGGNGDGYETEV